jgi:hypothetical protein
MGRVQRHVVLAIEQICRLHSSFTSSIGRDCPGEAIPPRDSAPPTNTFQAPVP